MLKRVEKPDEELTYTLNVLFDSALIRSGYDVNDSMIFAKNVEKVIRLNLKVGEMDEAVVDVKPAPATAPAEEATLESEEESEDADASVEEMMKGMGNGVKFSGKDQDGNVIMGGDHDEL
jgi:Hsp90 protein